MVYVQFMFMALSPGFTSLLNIILKDKYLNITNLFVLIIKTM